MRALKSVRAPRHLPFVSSSTHRTGACRCFSGSEWVSATSSLLLASRRSMISSLTNRTSKGTSLFGWFQVSRILVGHVEMVLCPLIDHGLGPSATSGFHLIYFSCPLHLFRHFLTWRVGCHSSAEIKVIDDG